MPWMKVMIDVDGNPPVENVINTDTIIRFGPRGTGSYIKFMDGTSIQVLDPMSEIIEVVLRADETKKAQNGLPVNE